MKSRNYRRQRNERNERNYRRQRNEQVEQVEQVEQARHESSSDEAQLDVKECSICTYSFHTDLPHFSCKEAHGTNICQPCFYSWVHGDIRADNAGFQQRSCSCGAMISHEEVHAVLDPEQFKQYDAATLRYVLSKDRDVLQCPGVNCNNAFLKPKKSKRACRKATCDHCDTIFCCLCGELYTKDHKRMKCGPYKKWKQTHDQETITMNEWKKNQLAVKTCPGCKKNVEKTSGCNDMRCTNCNMHFCWGCSKPQGPHGECGCVP